MDISVCGATFIAIVFFTFAQFFLSNLTSSSCSSLSVNADINGWW
jgi:hypothetical protein